MDVIDLDGAELAPVLTADSASALAPDYAGAVLVCGSHGGLNVGAFVARAGVRAAILHDACGGLDGAGFAALEVLEALGMAAAVVDGRTARIGDGGDMLARGTISQINSVAAALGVRPGQMCGEAAILMRAAPQPQPAPATTQLRHRLAKWHGAAVRGLDSAAQATAEDAGNVLVTGSHGGLLGGRPDAALAHGAVCAVFNDAGVGPDRAGFARLAVLDERGIAAVAVGHMSARIGDARSTWETGVLTHVNETARRGGGRQGQTTQDFIWAFTKTLVAPKPPVADGTAEAP